MKGISIDKIYQTIDTLPPPNNEIIYTMWEYSTQFSRNDTDLLAMAQMLKIDAKTLDEIFINENI